MMCRDSVGLVLMFDRDALILCMVASSLFVLLCRHSLSDACCSYLSYVRVDCVLICCVVLLCVV